MESSSYHTAIPIRDRRGPRRPALRPQRRREGRPRAGSRSPVHSPIEDQVLGGQEEVRDGSHLRIRLQHPQRSRCPNPVQVPKAPGALPSSMLGYEALTGSLDDFGFEDYLNMPQDSDNLRQPDMHHGMEVRLGLSKGPICASFN